MSWRNLKPISNRRGHVPNARPGLGNRLIRAVNMLAAAAALISISSVPAAALSCAEWDGAQAYSVAANSDRTYSIVVGRLQFDEALLPLTETGGYEAAPKLVEIAARLNGKILETHHFSRRISVDVTLLVECVASWCGEVQPGTRYLFFVEQGSSGPVVRATPCSGYIFPDGPVVRRQILDCHRGKSCLGR